MANQFLLFEISLHKCRFYLVDLNSLMFFALVRLGEGDAKSVERAWRRPAFSYVHGSVAEHLSIWLRSFLFCFLSLWRNISVDIWSDSRCEADEMETKSWPRQMFVKELNPRGLRDFYMGQKLAVFMKCSPNPRWSNFMESQMSRRTLLIGLNWRYYCMLLWKFMSLKKVLLLAMMLLKYLQKLNLLKSFWKPGLEFGLKQQ